MPNTIIGHQAILDYFDQAQSIDRLSHAYLFVGQQQLGKKMVAFHLAKALLCQKPTGLHACDHCISCQGFEKSIHPDFFLTQALPDKHQISIQQIRQMQAGLRQAPSWHTKKIAIIDNAHQLSKGASNAFLKILEEPPASSLIFLISHQPQQVLQTIKSRCQVIDFPPLPQELSQVDDPVLWKQSQQLPGRYLMAKQQVDQQQSLQQEVGLFLELQSIPMAKKINRIQELCAKNEDHGLSTQDWLNRISLWQQILRDQLMQSLNVPSLVNLVPDAVTTKHSPAKLTAAIDELYRLADQLRFSVNLKSNLEYFFLKHFP